MPFRLHRAWNLHLREGNRDDLKAALKERGPRCRAVEGAAGGAAAWVCGITGS